MKKSKATGQQEELSAQQQQQQQQQQQSSPSVSPLVTESTPSPNPSPSSPELEATTTATASIPSSTPAMVLSEDTDILPTVKETKVSTYLPLVIMLNLLVVVVVTYRITSLY